MTVCVLLVTRAPQAAEIDSLNAARDADAAVMLEVWHAHRRVRGRCDARMCNAAVHYRIIGWGGLSRCIIIGPYAAR